MESYTGIFTKYNCVKNRWEKKYNKKKKYCATQTQRGRGQETYSRIFPGDLISNNHNQIKSAVKYPSCFFLKMAPQKKQRATNTKEKNNMILSKTYIQWASNHDYKVKPSRVCVCLCVCLCVCVTDRVSQGMIVQDSFPVVTLSMHVTLELVCAPLDEKKRYTDAKQYSFYYFRLKIF